MTEQVGEWVVAVDGETRAVSRGWVARDGVYREVATKYVDGRVAVHLSNVRSLLKVADDCPAEVLP